MDEIEEIPLATAEGDRPRSTLGDRLIVSLAGIVLLGGVLIAATNLLQGLAPEGTAATSAAPSAAVTPTPSRTPRPSPTPRPLRDVTVEPGTPQPPPPVSENPQFGWLEILAPTIEYASPSTTARTVRELAAGEILLVNLDPNGWATETDPETGYEAGFVSLDDAVGNRVAAFFPVDSQVYPGHIEGIWAGPDALFASIWPPQQQYAGTQPLLVRSQDGERWTPVDADPALTVTTPQLAWGPEGWIAVSTSPYDGTPWIWQSYNGEDWEPLGELGTGNDSGWPSRLVASARGYELLFDEYRYNGSVTTTWFSSDGIYWQESADPLGRSEGERLNAQGTSLLGTNAGFVAWTVNYDYGAVFENRIGFSADGLHWTPVTMDDARVRGALQLAVVGDSLLVVGQGLTGTIQAWRADLAKPDPRLQRDAATEAALDGTQNVQLTGDGTTAYAFGYRPASSGPAIWSTDGSAWRRVRVPNPIPFGAAAYLGAVGPEGLVVIGSQSSVAGESPVMWHLRPDGRWIREPEPIIPAVADPSPEACGPLPSSAIEFAALSPTWGPICFGDEPMTFTAWAAPCDWCPREPLPTPTGTWLMEVPATMLLRPVVGAPWPYNEAVIQPGLEISSGLSGKWVRVTGHYDDPAAAACAYPPDPGNYYNPPEAAVTYCRQRFVVTALKLVDGP